MPNEPYEPDPNRLQLAPEADDLWRKIRFDRPLGKLGADAVTPGTQARREARAPRRQRLADGSPSSSASETAEPSDEERKQAAEEAGLCA